MNKCQNCGNLNTTESNFCRFCGTKFLVGQSQYQPQPQNSPPFELEPPRPYAWKTDEFSTQSEARKTVGGTERIGAAGQTTAFPNGQAQPLAYRPGQQMDQPYRCPNCMSQFLPRIERRISTGGWVTFALLLVFFFPLFWIGLLVKEDVRTCPSCGVRVG